MQSKYELQIKQININLEEATEQLLEVQSTYDDIEQKYSFEKSKWEESQASLKNNMSLSQGQYNEMQRTIDDLKSKGRNEVERL